MQKYGYWFMDGAHDENGDIYFFGTNIKGFFVWKSETGQVQLIDPLDNIDFVNEMYSNGIVCDGIVFFPPRMYEKLAVYDLYKKELTFHDLYTKESTAWGVGPSINGYHIEKFRDSLYFFYREKTICVKIKIENKKINYITYPEIQDIILSKDYIRKENILFFPSVSDKKIVTFDLLSEKYEILEESSVFNSINSYKDKIYLMPINENIMYEWNIVNNTKKKIILPELNADYGHSYLLLEHEYGIMIIPMMDSVGDMNDYYIYNPQNDDIEKHKLFYDCDEYKKWRMLRNNEKIIYMFYKSDNNDHSDLYWLGEHKFICLDLKSMSVSEIQLPVPNGWCDDDISSGIIRNQKKALLNTNEIQYESLKTSLTRYIEAIIN